MLKDHARYLVQFGLFRGREQESGRVGWGGVKIVFLECYK